jgi:hypothetical protein
MQYATFSVEDCLILLASPAAELREGDKKLIGSLSHQVDKGVGLTDRQLRLARKKLDEYKTYLESRGVDADSAKSKTDLEIRHIDRSRWIRFDVSDDGVKIAVRFRYAKKLIDEIERVKKHTSWSTYDAENKTWYFEYTESNLYEIVNAFHRFDFEISDAVYRIYGQICELDPQSVVPGVYEGELKNLPSRAVEMLEEEIGAVSQDTLALYKDRSIRYGLHYFDSNDLWRSVSQYSYLAQKIANRSAPSVVVEDNAFPVENIVLALEELKRLPVLVVIPSQTPETVVEIHKSIRNIIPPEDASVMFRLDNDSEGAYFNSWIKEQGLNNPIDKNKRILYTIDNRIPKPILSSEWQPRSVISLAQSTMLVSTRKILNYYADQDLIVHLENANGNIIKRGYFDMERIE